MKLKIGTIALFACTILAFAEETPVSEYTNVCDSAQIQDTWYYTYSECDTQTTQTSMLTNISKESVKGSQLSLISNFANKDLQNFQLSFGYNHVNGKMDGVQFLAFVNYAHYVDGAQLFGNVNVADVVDGVQFGHVNIADTVKGWQVGWVNIADEIDGYAIGLFSKSDNGLFHVDYTVEESGMNKITFATGKTFFTSYSIGYTFDGETNPYSMGMGFGYHKDIGRIYLETSLRGSMILDKSTTFSNMDRDHNSHDDLRYNTLVQLNARIGAEVISNIGLFGGVTYNGLETHGNGMLMGPWTNKYTKQYDDSNFWPGFEIGIRIGR